MLDWFNPENWVIGRVVETPAKKAARRYVKKEIKKINRELDKRLNKTDKLDNN